MITQVVTPSMLAKTDVVLANAVYFKGQWLKKFDPKATKSGDFQKTKGKVKKEFMNQTHDFKIYQSEDQKFDLLELPYVGEEVSMIVLLPAKGQKLESIEKEITAEKLSTAIQKLTDSKARKVTVSLPKMDVTWGTKDITSALTEAGMPKKADFTPLGSANLALDKILHKARIKMDEEGTEAAAVTAVITRLSMVKPPQFIANRPFLFLIRNTSTNEWLFIGRLVN